MHVFLMDGVFVLQTPELQLLHPEQTFQHWRCAFCVQLLLERGATTPSFPSSVKKQTKQGLGGDERQGRWFPACKVVVEHMERIWTWR